MRKFIPSFLLSWYHFFFALLGAFMFRFPAKKLVVIGVTGTNGKSTTVDMISRILREAGMKTASLSSVRFQIGEKEERNTLKMTMPGRLFIQKFLRKAVDQGYTHAVVEVTSEGILQHRHRFLNFHTAVLTNLSPEHIERHGSFERYKKTKGKLFRMVKKTHVINADDKHAEYFLQFPCKELIRYSSADAKNIQENEQGTRFQYGDTEFSLSLLGQFNVLNALAAICVAKSLEISLETSKKALEKMQGVPGRMEVVIQEPFRVVVDYAFTPAALGKVYKTLKPSSGKLLCVLGAAGGGRDTWKRPVLGGIAAQYCDRIIVTNEDPYEEDPLQIMAQVVQGTLGKAEAIEDRRVAVQRALFFARAGDTVVITGKGSEDSIAVKGGKKIPWDDREVVREEFSKLDKDTHS